MNAPPATTPKPSHPIRLPARKQRGRWLRTMVQWHWVSSAVCLAGMFLFSITGITLNHAGDIETTPVVVKKAAQVPPELLQGLGESDGDDARPLPADLAAWLGRELGRPLPGSPEWSSGEVYLSMPGPGADAWLTIDRESGEVEYERTSRGWIAYLNDLHKGRHTGVAWKWFMDLFALGTLVFCLTGVYLLYFHARHRRMTWPLVTLGLVVPFLLAALMSHLP